jgi:hypothetical protein
VNPYRPPPVLVPRLLRLTVNERVDKEGSVRSPLDEATVPAAAEGFRDAGVGRSRPASSGRSCRPDTRAAPPTSCAKHSRVSMSAPRSGRCPESGSTTAWYVSGNRVAGSGLDRAPREHHGAESIHYGGER